MSGCGVSSSRGRNGLLITAAFHFVPLLSTRGTNWRAVHANAIGVAQKHSTLGTAETFLSRGETLRFGNSGSNGPTRADRRNGSSHFSRSFNVR